MFVPCVIPTCQSAYFVVFRLVVISYLFVYICTVLVGVVSGYVLSSLFCGSCVVLNVNCESVFN